MWTDTKSSWFQNPNSQMEAKTKFISLKYQLRLERKHWRHILGIFSVKGRMPQNKRETQDRVWAFLGMKDFLFSLTLCHPTSAIDSCFWDQRWLKLNRSCFSGVLETISGFGLSRCEEINKQRQWVLRLSFRGFLLWRGINEWTIARGAQGSTEVCLFCSGGWK